MIGSLLFPLKDEKKRIRDPNKPSKFRMKVAYTLTSMSLAVMSIAWVKISLDKATSEKETQLYFMLLVFLLTSLYNLNRSIVWTVWDQELLIEEPAQGDLAAAPTQAATQEKASGSKKRAPKM